MLDHPFGYIDYECAHMVWSLDSKLESHGWTKSFRFMERILNKSLDFHLNLTLKCDKEVKTMLKDTKVYQFENISSPFSPFYISLVCLYMCSNSSWLFMSITNLILQYNMDMKRHMFHVHVIKKGNLFFWKGIELIIILNIK